MKDVELKIRNREYQSPSRARAALSRSHLGKKDKLRVASLIDLWENEGTVDHVVAGEPIEALESELVDVATGSRSSSRDRLRHAVSAYPTDVSTVAPVELDSSTGGPSAPLTSLATRSPVFRINMNAAVRVRLTLLGMSLLHAARDRVVVPDDLLQRQGVWETTLWELASALGHRLVVGEEPFEGCVLEVLDPRMRQ